MTNDTLKEKQKRLIFKMKKYLSEQSQKNKSLKKLKRKVIYRILTEFIAPELLYPPKGEAPQSFWLDQAKKLEKIEKLAIKLQLGEDRLKGIRESKEEFIRYSKEGFRIWSFRNRLLYEPTEQKKRGGQSKEMLDIGLSHLRHHFMEMTGEANWDIISGLTANGSSLHKRL